MAMPFKDRYKRNKDILEWYDALAVAVAVIALVFTFGLRVVQVDGHSMQPTLLNGERLLMTPLKTPAYFTSLPVKAMVQRMRDAGIPAAVSYTAGTYVCNYLLYTLLYLIDKKYPNVRGGFIHVPYAMEQVINKPLGTPSMDLRQIARGLETAVEAVAACG